MGLKIFSAAILIGMILASEARSGTCAGSYIGGGGVAGASNMTVDECKSACKMTFDYSEKISQLKAVNYECKFDNKIVDTYISNLKPVCALKISGKPAMIIENFQNGTNSCASECSSKQDALVAKFQEPGKPADAVCSLFTQHRALTIYSKTVPAKILPPSNPTASCAGSYIGGGGVTGASNVTIDECKSACKKTFDYSEKTSQLKAVNYECKFDNKIVDTYISNLKPVCALKISGKSAMIIEDFQKDTNSCASECSSKQDALVAKFQEPGKPADAVCSLFTQYRALPIYSKTIPAAKKSCSLPNGMLWAGSNVLPDFSVNSLAVLRAYKEATSDNCARAMTQSLKCDNGTLTPSGFTFQFCKEKPIPVAKKSCSLPNGMLWAGSNVLPDFSVNSLAVLRAYKEATSDNCARAMTQSLKCDNGTLTPSGFTFQFCKENPPIVVLPPICAKLKAGGVSSATAINAAVTVMGQINQNIQKLTFLKSKLNDFSSSAQGLNSGVMFAYTSKVLSGIKSSIETERAAIEKGLSDAQDDLNNNQQNLKDYKECAKFGM